MGGGFPPGKNDMNLGLQVMVNMLKGHAAAYRQYTPSNRKPA
jgi:beta-glucosidase/6-phospho-beta-glucosidase/beta-galactosidase